MKALILMFLAGGCCAQTTAPAVPPSPAVPTLSVSTIGTQAAYPGATLNFQIALTNSAGWNISGIGLEAWNPITSQAAGTASVAAQKTLYCGLLGCLLTGLTNPSDGSMAAVSNLAYQDGQVMTFSYIVPTTQQIGSTLTFAIPTPIFGVDITGAAVTINTAATPLSIPVTVNPACYITAQTDTAAFLAAPSLALLEQLVSYEISILAGTCSTQ